MTWSLRPRSLIPPWGPAEGSTTWPAPSVSWRPWRWGSVPLPVSQPRLVYLTVCCQAEMSPLFLMGKMTSVGRIKPDLTKTSIPTLSKSWSPPCQNSAFQLQKSWASTSYRLLRWDAKWCESPDKSTGAVPTLWKEIGLLQLWPHLQCRRHVPLPIIHGLPSQTIPTMRIGHLTINANWCRRRTTYSQHRTSGCNTAQFK